MGKLLRPCKIAVVGASEKEGFGGDTCRNVRELMADGSYYFVNIKGGTAFGTPCYRSMGEIPDAIDLAVICTPSRTVEGLLKEAAAKGAKAAVVYASGYSEVGTEEGRAAEKSLVRLCRELDLALMGPNCAGYVNYIDGISPFAFISQKRERKGTVGVISQSGQLALSMMDSPKMKFSYVVSAGNSSICKVEDYLDFLVDDPDTKVVAMYLEGVSDPAHFVQALKKAALKRKPIVVLKTGRSAKGQAIAASHTGSLAGTDRVYDALFRKFGVIRVDDLEELMSTALALSTLKKLPDRPEIASMNLSGGETGICADLGKRYGIRFNNFSAETLNRLKMLLPPYATPNNPLDMTTTLSYDVEKYAEALEIVMSDPATGLVAVGYTLLQEIADPAICYMAKSLELVCSKPEAKPVVMIPFAENTRNEEYTTLLEKIGIPVLPTSTYAFKILKNISEFAEYRPEDHNLDVCVPGWSAGVGKTLGETESRKLLSEYGIPFPDCADADSPENAAKIATEIGFPVAAKIDSPDIPHKTDAGCVRLNLQNAGQVTDAYREILRNAAANCPDAKVSGVQICKMIGGGTEMVIGAVSDPQFGPCVMTGLGGIFVEIFRDTAFCLAPVSRQEAMKMIFSLRGSKLLTGYRGSEALDVEALADALVAVSGFACRNLHSLKELDINPIFVRKKGACAADALVVLK